MYFKLSIRNAKRSYKEYFVYILTLIIFIIIIQVANVVAALATELGMAADVLPLSVAVVLSCLLNYISKYITSGRTKEFGIYTLLGMSKRKIANLFFLETFAIGIFGFMFGSILGVLISLMFFQLTVAAILQAVIQTAVYFVVMEFLCLIYTYRFIHKANILNLIKNKRNNEISKSSIIKWAIVFGSSFATFIILIFLLSIDLVSINIISIISVPFLIMLCSFYKCLFLYANKVRAAKEILLYKGDYLYHCTKLLSQINTNVRINLVLAISLVFSLATFIVAFTMQYSDLLPFEEGQAKNFMMTAQISMSIMFLCIYFCTMSIRQLTDMNGKTFNLLINLGNSIKQNRRILIREITLRFTMPIIFVLPIFLGISIPLNEMLNKMSICNNTLIIGFLIYLMCFVILYGLYFFLTYKISINYSNFPSKIRV